MKRTGLSLTGPERAHPGCTGNSAFSASMMRETSSDFASFAEEGRGGNFYDGDHRSCPEPHSLCAADGNSGVHGRRRISGWIFTAVEHWTDPVCQLDVCKRGDRFKPSCRRSPVRGLPLLYRLDRGSALELRRKPDSSPHRSRLPVGARTTLRSKIHFWIVQSGYECSDRANSSKASVAVVGLQSHADKNRS